MKTNAVFLDVRELWEEPQIECLNLLRIPLDQIENRINEIPQNEEIVVFCQSGGRSKWPSICLTEVMDLLICLIWKRVKRISY